MDNRQLRGELAALMGINAKTASAADPLRLDRVVTLRLYIARQLALQENGQEIDVADLERASRMVDELIPPAATQNTDNNDLTRLNDPELDCLERMLLKMQGETVEDVFPPPPTSWVPPQFASDLGYIQNRLIQYYDLQDSDRQLVDDLLSRTRGHEDRDGALLAAREEVERLRWQAERDRVELEDLKAKLTAAKTIVHEDEVAARLQKLLDETNEFLNAKPD